MTKYTHAVDSQLALSCLSGSNRCRIYLIKLHPRVNAASNQKNGVSISVFEDYEENTNLPPKREGCLSSPLSSLLSSSGSCDDHAIYFRRGQRSKKLFTWHVNSIIAENKSHSHQKSRLHAMKVYNTRPSQFC